MSVTEFYINFFKLSELTLSSNVLLSQNRDFTLYFSPGKITARGRVEGVTRGSDFTSGYGLM